MLSCHWWLNSVHVWWLHQNYAGDGKLNLTLLQQLMRLKNDDDRVYRWQHIQILKLRKGSTPLSRTNNHLAWKLGESIYLVNHIRIKGVIRRKSKSYWPPFKINVTNLIVKHITQWGPPVLINGYGTCLSFFLSSRRHEGKPWFMWHGKSSKGF